MAIQITPHADNGTPVIGQEGSVGSTGLVSISGTTLAADATSAVWELTDGSAWGGTWILAIVLADQSGQTGIDPGGFLSAGSGNSFIHEAGWSLPSGSQEGTGWVAIPPPSGATLTIRAENPNSSETFQAAIYFYSVDVGLWWVESTVTVPVEGAT